MNFLIQTINNQIVHDFSFTLIESIKYNKWLNRELDYELTDIANLKKDYIPVGTVEFVTRYLREYYSLEVKPRNIPEELFKFSNRKIINGNEEDIKEVKFVKSNDVIKGFTQITDNAPKGNYQISDIIEIESEWRAFVFRKELVGLQNYNGDFTLFPNVHVIKEMINSYHSSPVAYTLDVALSNYNTVPIEVHDFFSCGLYGFSNHRIYPYMLSQWFYNFIKK